MALFILSLLAYAATGVAFLYCADQDARSWVTVWDQLTHPYRLRTQVLLLPVLFGWTLPLFLWDHT